MHPVRAFACLASVVLLLSGTASATTLPRLSFEELTDNSDLIVSGKVTRSWTAWDSAHKYIWTHYEVAVDSAAKGASSSTVDLAEPGGAVGIVGMAIAGSVKYSIGESVMVFAKHMPNGYLRTTGWSQGRFGIDSEGMLHADSSLKDVELVTVQARTATNSTPLRSLEGMSLRELRSRIAARVQAKAGVR